jgi:ribosomal protein S1
VNEFELVVSLADHHTAFVSCNRVSKHLEAVFKSFTGEESDDEEDKSKSISPPTLKDFYKVGDGVIGTIVAVQSGTEGKKRKRLELSLIPAQVNSDLSLDDLEVGMMIPGEIKSIEDRGYVVDLGIQKDVVGFLAFGAQDSEKMDVGVVVQCRVSAKNRAVVTLEIAGNEANKAGGLKNYSSLRPGTLVENVEIKAIHEGLLNVMINETHTGQIDIFNLPVSSTLVNPKTNAPGITANYFVGMKIPSARIVFADCHVGADEKSLILSALPSVLSSNKVRREIEAIPDETAAIGTKFDEARIVRIDPSLGVILALDSEGTEFAQVHISRLSDEKITKIIAPYRQNSLHACRIIDYDPFAAIAIASMTPSCLNQQFLSIDSIPVGSVVRGEVTTITPGLGILVNLSERIRALCPINQLTETQSQEALKSYRLGQKFKFRVLSTDPSSRRVMLTRKKGLLESEIEPLCDYKDAVVGEFYDGYVASIRPFGCIVRFCGDVKAILPLSELTEETFVKEAKEVVFEGQVVRCRVIRLDKEAQSMAVSLRKTDTPKAGKRKFSEEKKVIEKKPKTEIVKVRITETTPVPAPATESPDSEGEKSELVGKKSIVVQSPPDTPEKIQVKAVLPSLRQLEEEELAKEEMLMNVEASVPTTQKEVKAEDLLSMKEMCEEFERRLLGSPNSSILWIQYMSILIKSMELDAARSLAQRALQTISIRSEAEKLNIWIALMNLEQAYGTAATLKATFDRACVFNDSKAVHLALASIYEESARVDQPETIKTVEEFYNSALMKKFRQSCKVWMNLAQFYFTVKKDVTSARKLLPKALESLPRRKHMKATLKFAQMEFRHGNLERGRTLFEGLIASSPSRLDIWSQFCDQEERHLPESIENLRNLYTRIIHLKLSSKKAKFFFKKFLEFEKQYGDQLTVQNVKDLAQKYVESTMNKN